MQIVSEETDEDMRLDALFVLIGRSTGSVMNRCLIFPHAVQVAYVPRETLHAGKNKTTLETVYLINSLARARANPNNCQN